VNSHKSKESIEKEFFAQQVGDNDIESWEKCQEMSRRNPTNLNTYYDFSKRRAEKTNLRNLDAKLDGDWYFLLQDLLGTYIEKIRPGRTSFRSNINNEPIDEFYGSLGHIRCGQSESTSFSIRLSSCMFCNGSELQIPMTEVKDFKYNDYYFFEDKGLFVLFNTKKFEALSESKKWLACGAPTAYNGKRFGNNCFSTMYLLKFGCIDQYGYCDGNTIYKGRNLGKTSLRYNSKGKLKTKYLSFPKLWMRGCRSTLKPEKYLAILLSESLEIIGSQTIAGLTKNMTDKNGEKQSRQTYEHQIKVNSQNYLDYKISQKLSLAYVGKKPYFLMKKSDKYTEEDLMRYIMDIRREYDIRNRMSGITSFLLEKDLSPFEGFCKFLEEKHGIPVQSYLDLKLEERKESDEYLMRSDPNNNYYKKKIAYYANRKRGFITKEEKKNLLFEILEEIPGFNYYYLYKSWEQTKFFAHLKTIRKKNGIQRGNQQPSSA
jgi:hypothetical protein